MAGSHSRQAVILAGGQGTRLRPLTLERAKPVVPLLNRPFLAYQLALLRAHGVFDVVLACSYRVDDVRASMQMGQPFPGVWLPRAIDGHGAFTLANGTYEVKYDLAYSNYRLADVKVRLR